MVDLTEVPLDFGKYEEYIGASGNINFVDRHRLTRTLSMADACSATCKYHMNNQLKYALGGYNTIGDSPQKARDVFIECGVPEKIFVDKKNKTGYSFDSDRQADFLYYLENTYNLPDHFINFYNYMYFFKDNSSNSSVVSSMRRGIRDGYVTDYDKKGYEDIDLSQMYNVYVRQLTGRYYARQLPIVQLPRAVRQCITVPKGYIMLCIDLRQIDMRVAYNIYLRSWYPEYDEIFDREKDDKYKAMYDIIHLHLNRIPDMDYFSQHRPAIKKNILSAMYGAKLPKLQTTLDDQEFNKLLVDFFTTHKGRAYYVNKIEKLFELGEDFIVRDFFGYEMEINVTGVETYGGYGVDSKNRVMNLDKVIDLVFSRTIQSTSNSIIIKSVNDSMDKCRSIGIRDIEMWINQIRHDEISYTVHKSVIDKIIPIYEGMTIQIADWDDISFDYDVYIHYDDIETVSEYEKDLVLQYSDTVKSLVGKYDKSVPRGKKKQTKCIPTVHELFIFSMKSPKKLYKDLTFRDVHLTDEQIAYGIYEMSNNGILDSNFLIYKDVYNKSILRNANTGVEKIYYSYENLEKDIIKYGIEYLHAYTISGDGFSLIGNCSVIATQCVDTSCFDKLVGIKDAK